LITVAVISYMLWRLDGARFAESLANIDAPIMASAIVALTVQMVVQAAAWFTLLRAADSVLPFGVVARITFVSLFFNQFVPASVGGVGTRILLASRENVRWATASSTVVAERIVYIVGLIVLAVLTYPRLVGLRVGRFDAWYLVGFSTAIGLGGLFLWKAEWLTHVWQRAPILRRLSPTLLSARQLLGFSRPLDVSIAFLLILVYHALTFFAVWRIAVAIGSNIEFFIIAALLPHVFLISVLPISVNGWGVREAAMVGMLAFAGVDAELAFMTSAFYGIGILLTRLPMGFLWLAVR
jgi:uncharacterized membrane protein YbhN (UPF0104 family)